MLRVLRRIRFAEYSVTQDGKNSMKQFFTVFAELCCLLYNIKLVSFSGIFLARDGKPNLYCGIKMCASVPLKIELCF